ncbi:hypothetical protein C8R44DRAFT_663880 [Mycena epipterygia]|nr:hypothetical protein C8R44DRAFT_663880 [Mycena epipterygia]
MASLWKLPFLLAGALFHHRSCTQPTVPASQDEQKRTISTAHPTGDWFEDRIIPILPAWNKLVYWAFTITETSAILANYFAVDESSTFVVESNHFGGRFTPAFLFGTGLNAAGAIIRFRCFREMDRHFTFSLSLRDSHRLITTGPYAVVRHPSYTGAILIIFGAALIFISDGSWWLGGGYATVWGRFLASNFIICSIVNARGVFRGAKEDVYLKKAFGEQWVQFASDVPYMYIPGVW